jgi:hypothetical protein
MVETTTRPNRRGGGFGHPQTCPRVAQPPHKPKWGVARAFFFLNLTFKFLKFYYFFNKVNNMCQVLICLTWNSISFINGIWMEVVFDNMPISEVPHAIESETKVGKIKL